jgi:hypothetical protein
MSKAMELYFRYHPAVFKMKTFEALVKDETFRQKQATEQQERIDDELSQLDGLIARYRQTGAGPSGTADLATGYGTGRGGRSRSRTGGGGGVRGGADADFLADMSRNEIQRAKIEADAGEAALKEFDRRFAVPRTYKQFEAEFIGSEERRRNIRAVGASDIALELESRFLDVTGRMMATGERATDEARKEAATSLYYAIKAQRPDIIAPAGATVTEGHREIMEAIDRAYNTGGFLTRNIMAGMEPEAAMYGERQRVQAALGSPTGPGFFEEKARDLVGKMPLSEKDTDGDGVVSPQENAAAMEKAMGQARQELGIAAPLTEEEQVALQSYLRALRDDGVATREELGANFEAAQAAYDKARRVENLPRGAAPYFDDTFLDLLQRRSRLRGERAEIPRGTPMERAALRTQGLPVVSTEAYAAAAAVSPLAAEAMPYAMKRFTDASGDVEPQSMVERKGQAIIDASPGGRPAFTDYAAQVNKAYPNDPEKRREALAYYGAYFHAVDTKGSTLDPNILTGNVKGVVDELTPSEPTPSREKARRDSTLTDSERGVGVEEQEVERLMAERAGLLGASLPDTLLTPSTIGENLVGMDASTPKGRVMPRGTLGGGPLLPGELYHGDPLGQPGIGMAPVPPTPARVGPRVAPADTTPLYPGDPFAGGALYQGDPMHGGSGIPSQRELLIREVQDGYRADPANLRYDAQIDMATGQTFYVDPATGAQYNLMPDGSFVPRR